MKYNQGKEMNKNLAFGKFHKTLKVFAQRTFGVCLIKETT